MKLFPVFAIACAAATVPQYHATARMWRGGQAVTISSGIPATGDEFVGPFVSWYNVKLLASQTDANGLHGCPSNTVQAAVGDGAANDTTAIQACLNDIGSGSNGVVLWFPQSSTYKITTQLTLAAKQAVSMLGEDPSTTIIKWAGAANGVMLRINGADYSRVSRLTFDGSSISGVIGIDQGWDGSTGFADSGNEYADDTFKNMAKGFRCGVLGNQCSEITIIRDHFINNTTYGVTVENGNALDIWVRYSTFDNCAIGITNIEAFGQYRAYNNIFRNSTVADMSIGNTSDFSIRGNYSIGSKVFFTAPGSGNPSPTVFQGNTILDTTDRYSISIGNQGPVTLYDNVIRTTASGSTGVVLAANASGSGTDAIALGNTITASSLLDADRSTQISTSIVSSGSIPSTEPTIPGTEPNFHRQVFDVAVGANAAAIQSAINSAAAVTGTRPVVHLPAGTYNIASTITIPANADLQLTGDGYVVTVLSWTGGGTGPVLQIAGPSKATLRNFQVNGGSGAVEGIAASGIDQSGARVFMHGVFGSRGRTTNLFADSMDFTTVEADDFLHQDQTSFAGSISVKVVGGALAAAGNPQGGKVNIYSGASAVELVPYDVSSGGTLVARDSWYESSPSPTFLHVSGRAAVTMEGDRVALTDRTTPGFDIVNLNGKVSLLDLELAGNAVISGNGSAAQVLEAGGTTDINFVPTSPYLSSTASPAATFGLLDHRQWGNSAQQTACGCATIQTANAGTIDNAFVTSMFAQTRAAIQQVVTALPGGTTDLRMYRVWANDGTNNIHLAH